MTVSFTTKFQSDSEADTKTIAEKFAERLKPGDVVALFGKLGSGKTIFVKGICSFFGIYDHVTSPTFVILHEYQTPGGVPQIKHFDLYRLSGEDSLREIGIDDVLWNKGNICLIEWPERIENRLKKNFYKITLENKEESSRLINIDFIS